MSEPYGKSTWRKPDPNTMFVVGYADGTSAYFTMTPKALKEGDHVARSEAVRRQAASEVPSGEITSVCRVR